VVVTGQFLADGAFHQPGQGWEHVDRGIDLSVVKLAVHKYLALCDVTGQIGDRVRDVCGLGWIALGYVTCAPSLGIVRMGTWVIEPFLPSTRPARSYSVERSVYK
jgi:hypothetical protein